MHSPSLSSLRPHPFLKVNVMLTFRSSVPSFKIVHTKTAPGKQLSCSARKKKGDYNRVAGNPKIYEDIALKTKDNVA